MSTYTSNARGKDFNYFNRISVSSGSFGTTADVVFNFHGRASFTLINEGSGTVSYSFNGTTTHGDLVPGTASAALSFDDRAVFAIWFKLSSGATSNVRVEGWAAV